MFGDFIKDLRVAYTQNRTSNKGIEVQTHYKVKRIGPGPKAYVFDLKDEEGLAAGIKLSGILNILKRERRDTKENDLHKSLMTLYPVLDCLVDIVRRFAFRDRNPENIVEMFVKNRMWAAVRGGFKNQKHVRHSKLLKQSGYSSELAGTPYIWRQFVCHRGGKDKGKNYGKV